MAKVRLGDVAVERKETSKNNQPFPTVGLEHLIPEEVTLTQWEENSDNTFTKIFRKGDVLFGRRRAYLKKAAVAPMDGICSGDITVVSAKPEKIKPELLPFIIQNDDFFDFAVEKSAGSLSPRAKWQHLKDYEFNLPDLDEQERLAEILWAMQDTKRAYQNLLKRTDELVKSQFIEMFGLPFSEGWPVNGKFADFTLKMLKGPFGSDMKKTLFVEKGPDTYKVYVQINAIQQDETLGEYYISKEYYESKMHRFEAFPGEYLITCDGTLGKYIRLDDAMEPGVISPSMLSLKLDEERIVPRFFETYWSLFILDYLISKTRNTALVHLPSAKAIGDVDVVIPDMKDQIRFAEIAEQSDKSKFDARMTSNLNLSGFYGCWKRW